MGGKLSVELLHQGGVHSLRPAAVSLRTDGCNGSLDGLTHLRVLTGVSADDAVTVCGGLFENLYAVGGICKGNLVLVETQIGENLPGAPCKSFTCRVFRIDAVQRKGIASIENKVLVLDY